MDVLYDQTTSQVTVFVDVPYDLALDRDYRLFVAITEDGVAAQGPNGEPIHNQAFRWLFPGTEGTPVATAAGMHIYNIDVALDDAWVFDNLRATTWVQEYSGGPVLNSATRFLHEDVVHNDDDPGEDIEEDDTPALVTRLEGANPNPFNPMTTVKFSLAREQHVTLSVFDMSGRRVAVLADDVFAAGEHPVVWNGRDLAGREAASGTYFLHMISEEGIRSAKMMLVR
jgi:hypothetical protein